MLVAMVCRDGANRAPSRVAWLDRRVTKRRRPAINKEDINPKQSTLDRSSSPSPTYVEFKIAFFGVVLNQAKLRMHVGVGSPA